MCVFLVIVNNTCIHSFVNRDDQNSDDSTRYCGALSITSHQFT